MTKAAKRQRAKSRARLRQAQNTGRPRQEGERLPNGRLAPPEPNARVLEQRRALAGDADLASATIPLDLAFARGWISEAHHRTGMRLKGLYLAAGLKGPRTTASAGAEVETANDDLPFSVSAKSVYATMSDKEIGGIWDGTFNREDARVSAMPTLDPRAYDQIAEMGSEPARAALTNWRKAMDAMTANEREEVFRVCILDSWPFWITDWAAGRTDTARSHSRTILTSGLERAAHALRKPAETRSAPRPWVDPGPKPKGPKLVSERITHVNAAGEFVREVVKVARR